MSDDDILRLARSGQDLDHLASMIDDATIEIASTGGRWFDETATRGHWGREAEDLIRGDTGGKSKRLDAPVAGERFRIVDDYVDDNGLIRVNEVKTGDGRMERRLQTQIDKDAYLAADTVDVYTWNFFPSARSNRVGPDPELLAELQANGLKVKLWLP